MDDTKRIVGALLLAREKLLAMRSTVREVEQSYKDFVTDADIASQKILIEILKRHFPSVPAYSEECGGEIVDSGFMWIIDPLDGTLNYFRQDPYHWGISVALVRDRKTEIGAIALPGTNYVVVAKLHAEGATALAQNSSKRLRVSKTSELSGSAIWTDWSKRGYPDSTLSIINRLSQSTRYPQIRLSAVASLVAVAEGRIDAYVHPGPEPFDIAAGCLIVEKAGGRVTDIDGNPWNPFSSSIVATNGYIHTELLDALN